MHLVPAGRDALDLLRRQEFRAVDSRRADENRGSFFSHQRASQRSLHRGAERNGSMVLEQDQFRHVTSAQ